MMLLITDGHHHSAETSSGPSPSAVVTLDAMRDIDPSYSAVHCDVRLDSFANLDRLRGALLKYRPDASFPLVFLVHDADPLAYALANALGATQIISPSRQTAPSPYAAVPGRGDIVAPTVIGTTPPLAALVATVASTLEQMFSAAEKHMRLSLDNLSSGADALILAVNQRCISEWVSIVRSYDDATYQHCLLVAGFVAGFADKLGLSFKAQHLLLQAALVHDIGKVRVPRAVLNKDGPLSPVEMELVRKHPATGYFMIAHQKGIDGNVLDIVRHHHEYLDGTGYPDRLKGAQISELCRLVTICDIFAALIEKRPYRPPMPPSGSLHDPARHGQETRHAAG